jgi:hypothetical protein
MMRSANLSRRLRERGCPTLHDDAVGNLGQTHARTYDKSINAVTRRLKRDAAQLFDRADRHDMFRLDEALFHVRKNVGATSDHNGFGA